MVPKCLIMYSNIGIPHFFVFILCRKQYYRDNNSDSRCRLINGFFFFFWFFHETILLSGFLRCPAVNVWCNYSILKTIFAIVDAAKEEIIILDHFLHFACIDNWQIFYCAVISLTKIFPIFFSYILFASTVITSLQKLSCSSSN